MAVRFTFDGFELDLGRYEVRRDGEVVAVEPQVFDVLVHLVSHRDRVVSKEDLLDKVWGERFVSESALTSRIKAARRALGDDGTAQRMTTSPGNAVRFMETFQTVDVVDLASAVSVPTLVLHARRDARVPVAEGRRLAALIPGSRFVPLESPNHLLLGDEPAWPRFMNEVGAFLTEHA